MIRLSPDQWAILRKIAILLASFLSGLAAGCAGSFKITYPGSGPIQGEWKIDQPATAPK